MIPQAFIDRWRASAPWTRPAMVEQDLVLSRALVALFREPAVRETLLFRGGTALYKLHLRPAVRFSEDIDLGRPGPGPSGRRSRASGALSTLGSGARAGRSARGGQRSSTGSVRRGSHRCRSG